MTGGELVVKDTRPDDLRMIRLVFERLGLRSELHGHDVIVPGNQELVIRNEDEGRRLKGFRHERDTPRGRLNRTPHHFH